MSLPASEHSRLGVALACAVVMTITALMTLVAPFRYVSGDTVPGRIGGAVLRCSGTFDLARAAWIREAARKQGPAYWAQYDRGQALVSVYGPTPAIVVSLVLPDLGPGDSIDDESLRWRERIAAALALALAAGLMTLAAAATRSLRAAVACGLLAASSFAGAATLGQGIWQQTIALPWLVLALASLTWRGRLPRIAVLTPPALVLAVLIRPTVGLLALALGIAWLAGRPSRRIWVVAFVGTCLVAVPFIAWNLSHFGTPLSFGQWTSNARFGPDVFVVTPAQLGYGLGGLLLSPGRGLIWFAPVVVVGCVVAFRTGTRLERIVAAGIAAQIVTIACFHMWWGGICYGPRFLAEAVWLGIWLAFDRASRGWLRATFIAACVATIFVGQLGLWAWRAEQWETRRNPDIDQNALWDPIDSPIASTFSRADDQPRAIDDLHEPARMTCVEGLLQASP